MVKQEPSPTDAPALELDYQSEAWSAWQKLQKQSDRTAVAVQNLNKVRRGRSGKEADDSGDGWMDGLN